jgi:ribosomal protein S18 acetylase RimI-like enzyme
MTPTPDPVRIRPLTELDLSRITAIDERLTGIYRPEVWERRVAYYIRRDPEACQVADVDGRVMGFMLADVRGGEFGLEETSGWIERFGVDPDSQGRSLGRRLFEAVVDHLRAQGVVSVRTLVGSGDEDLAAFLRAVGFVQAPLTALEKRLDVHPDAKGPGR